MNRSIISILNLVGARAGIFLILAGSLSTSCAPVFYDPVYPEVADTGLAISPFSKTLVVNENFTFSAAGGVAPYTYSVFSGQGSINGSSGAFAAPASAGSTVVRVTDSQGNTSDAAVTINAALAISPTNITLAAGASQVFSASGGVSDYAYSVVSGGGGFIGATYTAPAVSAGAAVTVKVTDSIGNISQTSVTVPAITVSISAPSAGAVINGAGQASVAVSGACTEEGRTVSVAATGGAVATPSCSSGSWSTTLDLTSASDGAITISANHSNVNAVAATAAQVAITKDATAPTSISITTPTAVAYVTNANKAAFTISGSCSEVGTANVNVKADATSLGTVNCASGSFTGSFDLTSISDGAVSLTAVLSDTAGNSLTSSAVSVTKDVALNAPAIINDGTWWASTSTSPVLSFGEVTDTGSGLNRYEVALGTSAGGSNTADWSSSGILTSKQFDSLTLADGTMYYASVRAVDNAGNVSSVTQGNGFTVDTAGPSAPTGVSLGSVPENLTDSPTITFTAAEDALSGTASSHEVKIIKTSNSAVIQDWTAHTSGAAVAGISPDLEASTEYSVLVRGIDGAGNEGTASSAVSWTAIAPSLCPTGYIEVPPLSGYTTEAFCVAKYEAKESGAAAISQASGFPWVSINRDNARTACQANGAGYDLISNAEWQTIARNIELTASNWNGGVIGTNSLNRGHSDGAPNNALAASTDDNDACFGTGQTCSSTVWDAQRRTHVLSNGGVIWDLAGNVWDWVRDDNTTNFGADAYMSQVTTDSHTTSGTVGAVTGSAKAVFGPGGNYTSLNVGEYGGFGKGSLNYPPGAVMRGNYWNDGTGAGVFSVILYNTPLLTNVALGVRCVWSP